MLICFAYYFGCLLPYSCGLTYVGQTGRTIATRIKAKSIAAEHQTTIGHVIKFRDAVVSAKADLLNKRLAREALEIEKFATFNRENGPQT